MCKANRQSESIDRRNYRGLLFDGIFFMPAMALFEPTTTIPLLVERLSGSSLLVGLVGTLRLIGMWFPALPVANWVKHREYKKRWVIFSCLLRFPLGLLSLGFFLLDEKAAGILLALVFLAHTCFWLGEGFAGVPWTDIVGKCIPAERRGRFFGMLQFWGNIAAFGAGFFVRWILDNDGIPYPTNYAILFTGAFILFILSLVAFGFVKEPRGETRVAPEPFAVFVRRLPGYLRANPLFVRIAIIIFCMGLGGLALPFYVLYATEKLALPGAVAGYFISAQTLGMVIGGALWGYLGDYCGHRQTMPYVALIQMLAPVVALLGGLGALAGLSLVIMLALYVLLGIGMSGWVVTVNCIMEVTTPVDRAVYLALSNTLQIPLFAAPFIGGYIVQASGYTWLFILAAAFPLLAVLLALQLRALGGYQPPRASLEQQQIKQRNPIPNKEY